MRAKYAGPSGVEAIFQKTAQRCRYSPVLVGNQAQHPPFFHRPGTAEDLIGPTGKDFLPDTAAQLIHEITVDRIGLTGFSTALTGEIQLRAKAAPSHSQLSMWQASMTNPVFSY